MKMPAGAKLPPDLLAGSSFTFCVVLLALLGFFWTPCDPSAMNMGERLAASSSAHWLGTDHFGRDILSLLLAGLSRSLLIALSAVALGGYAGLALGLIAALKGKTLLDAVLSRTADFLFVFPALLTAMMMATLYGPSSLNAVIAIAIFNIPVFFRITRALAASLLTRDFVRAAQALGQDQLGLLRRHILPGCASVLIVQISIQLALALLAEASLSYLGLGVPAPQPSLGRMLQDAQTYFQISPRLALLPGATIALTVLAFNLLGDGLRDYIDPRLRHHFF